MLLHCPACSTGYDVPERCGGRRLRCARCRTEWRPPAGAAALPPAAVEPAEEEREVEAAADSNAIIPTCPEPMVVEAEEVERRRRRVSLKRCSPAMVMLAACWLLTLGMVGGSAYAAFHWRGAIAHRWPPSQRIYALLPSA